MGAPLSYTGSVLHDLLMDRISIHELRDKYLGGVEMSLHYATQLHYDIITKISKINDALARIGKLKAYNKSLFTSVQAYRAKEYRERRKKNVTKEKSDGAL